MTAPRHKLLTSPCKGEVDREAGGRGSRFSRTKAVTARARTLRGKMTDAETRLCYAVRRDRLNGLHFRRQPPVGPYTLDFYCPSLRLAVEVDGGQNAEHRKQADDRRTRWLAEKGVVIVRYSNNDVLSNLPGVLSDLWRKLKALRKRRQPPPQPSPLQGEGGQTPVVLEKKGARDD